MIQFLWGQDTSVFECDFVMLVKIEKVSVRHLPTPPRAISELVRQDDSFVSYSE